MLHGRRLVARRAARAARRVRAVLEDGIDGGRRPARAGGASGARDRRAGARAGRAAAGGLARGRRGRRLSRAPRRARSRRPARKPAASSSSSSRRSASSRRTISSSRAISRTRRAARSSAASSSRPSARARALAQQLARTGRLLTTELDPAAVLDEVVQQAPELVHADACAIRVLEDDELVVNAAVGHGSDAALGSRSSAVGVALGRRRAVARAGRARERGRRRAPARARSDARCRQCCVPRRAARGPEGAPLGVLAVYCEEPRPWREEEVEALLALAASTSAALSSAELYQRVAMEKERSFAILANIADGIVAVDREGQVVLWNEAAEKITGVPAADALGRAPEDVLQRSARSGSDTPLGDRLVSDAARPRGGVALGHRGGHARSLRRRRGPHLRVPRHLVGSARRADEVGLRLHGLARAAHAAHVDLRLRGDAAAPGRPVRRRGAADVPRLHRVRVAAADGDRRCAAQRRAARHRRPQGATSRRPTCAASSTRSCRARRTERANGHQFVVDLPAEPLAANADRDKLRQVFSILLDNALKYSREGGKVTVGVELKRDTVEVSVADEGIGIPQADQDQIFRKFYRGADAETRVGASGTGLGLVHRPRARDRHGRQDLGRVARRRRIDIRVRAARGRTDQGSLGT